MEAILQHRLYLIYPRAALGFRVRGSGFRVWGLGSRVQGLDFGNLKWCNISATLRIRNTISPEVKCTAPPYNTGLGFMGLGFKVLVYGGYTKP